MPGDQKLECPHCGMQGRPSNMRRYHFDHCLQHPARVRVKVCVECHVERPFEDFDANVAKRAGLQQVCRPCQLVRRAEYRARPEVQRAVRVTQRMRKYGLTREAAELVSDVRFCQSCGIGLTDGTGPTGRCVDHDHESLHVRGVICRSCNIIEGLMRDRDHATRVVDYLTRTGDPSFDWYADRLCWLEAHRRHD